MKRTVKKSDDKPQRKVLVFVDSKGVLSLWIKQYIWHKWIPKTPKEYANSMAKTVGKKPDYGPCFWGMHAESPQEKGYTFIGILDETPQSFL